MGFRDIYPATNPTNGPALELSVPPSEAPSIVTPLFLLALGSIIVYALWRTA